MRERSTLEVSPYVEWSNFFDDKTPYRWGAVLVSLFDMPQGPRIAFILRPESMKIHAGQVAFPGGSVDVGDRTPWDTACREAYEEIGVVEDDLVYMGYLSPEDVLVSRFKIVPVLARGARPMTEKDFSPSPQEVSRLIFCDPTGISSNPLTVEGEYNGTRYDYPVYPLDEGIDIWGATARILRRSLDSGILSFDGLKS
nr:CoA pyrophosphatase [uncultured Dethiosulfovibrio sp.]